MKNYYEILEISQNASPEVVEKAYKTLAKKYHPDMQPPEKKSKAEIKFKELGEAYEIISDKNNRSNYDIELKEYFDSIEDSHSSNNVSNEDYANLLSHTADLEEQLENFKKQTVNTNNIEPQTSNIPNTKVTSPHASDDMKNVYEPVNRAVNDAINKAYHDAYYQKLRDYGYKIKYKKTFKERFKNFVSLFLTIIILFVLFAICWQIPTFRNYLISFYNSSTILPMLINLFKNI